MKPLVVGIAGGTGSGKTTVAKKIEAALPPGSVTMLEHDAYYRDRSALPPAERDLVNFDHPDALETELLTSHLRAIRRGETVDVPVYDFATHTRKGETRRVEPRPVVVLEGILVFVEKALRDEMDVRIFVDTDADVRVLRRIRRDIEQRGRTFESVREQYYRTVRPMHLEFVEPSKRWADVILPGTGNLDIALDVVVAKLRSVVDGRDSAAVASCSWRPPLRLTPIRGVRARRLRDRD